MAFTLTRTLQVNGNGISLSATAQFAYSGNPHASESVPDGTTNVYAAIPYATMAFLAIFASAALTLQAKTAGGVSVGDPITVSATKAFVWDSDSGLANPFDDDVAYFAVVNATGANVTLSIEPLVDATP